MIDIETEIYNLVANAVLAEFPSAFVTGDVINGNPPRLPCVSFAIADNYTTRQAIDSSEEEKYSDLLAQTTVYSNKVTGKKSQCKAIMQVVDRALFRLNFTRESSLPETPINNGAISVLVARHTARTNGTRMFRR